MIHNSIASMRKTKNSVASNSASHLEICNATLNNLVYDDTNLAKQVFRYGVAPKNFLQNLY